MNGEPEREGGNETTPYRTGRSPRHDPTARTTTATDGGAQAFEAALAYRDARVVAWLSLGLGVGAVAFAWGHGAWMASAAIPATSFALSLVRIRRARGAITAASGDASATPPS